MAKINNYTVYNQDIDISDLDYVIGSNGDTTAKKTRNYSLGSLRRFFLAGLSPELGGTLRISEIVYTGEDYTTFEDIANNLEPAFEVLQYHIVIFNLNGTKALLKLQNRFIGIDEIPVLSTDFIILSTQIPDFKQVTDVGYVTDNQFYRDHDLGEAAGKYGVLEDGIPTYPVLGIQSYSTGTPIDDYYKILGFIEENYSGNLYISYQIKGSDSLPNRNLLFSLPIKNNISYPDYDEYTLATTADLRPYKVYSAIISQDNTGIPFLVTNVLENSIGTITVSGTLNNFTLTRTNAFTINKTFIQATTTYTGEDGDVIINVNRSGKTTSVIPFTSNVDSVNTEHYIEIQVYN